jgi:molecular chaperone GrpE
LFDDKFVGEEMMTKQKNATEETDLQASETPEDTSDTQMAEPGEDLATELEEAKIRIEESRDQLLRAQAELENTRRRAQLDVEKAHKFGLEKFAQELLPVKDSLELGLAASTGDDEAVVKSA